MRIIGIELRVKFQHERYGCHQQEISIIPTDIEFHFDTPGNHYLHSMNGTLHTASQGDIAIPDFQLPSHCAHVMFGRELVHHDTQADHRGLIIRPHR